MEKEVMKMNSTRFDSEWNEEAFEARIARNAQYCDWVYEAKDTFFTDCNYIESSDIEGTHCPHCGGKINIILPD